MALTLDTYRLLGRSGLRVSPLALGAATFGTEWGWGAERDEARKLFDLYTGQGGNFIDTANTYTGGSSERMLGEFARGDRESLVLATKYTTLRRPGDPNSGGAHRKSLFASVESSLRQLGTDYIDLLYLHVWDATTPVEEILRGMDDLVRQGKVLYVAISNAPAWQVSRMQTIADLRGWSPLVALQIEYNLVERSGERDLIPMAREMGLGVVPYSPLAGGVLTGKYTRDDLTAANDASGDGTRKSFNLALGTLTERSLAIADVVKEVAAELGRSPAQVGLAWALRNPAVTAPVIGARTPAQLEDNLGALEVDLTDGQLARLDAAGAIDLGFPHDILASDHIRTVTTGGLRIEPRR
ncbi:MULTISPECIES: aldo/keto reductase [Streptomycetaceae]|uniref:Aldo/keto reductase n=1 Tax=Streptantibioticus cattleyicolor (strain ATCC 35852 / DSM 46488 / JCM 4925 / NBRC 14057 / NRRL 8057) TaxID=1003195 RepID=F8JQU6_STREN|nr:MULTISPECIES: aldo/keto reductase [Streptomycetaceae]AEW92827.1 aldo/keto reductase [Streptantibioticus cattleyicolor NRRL 8057 = DSM 46488]MYS57586.1 aldo/keto reductase [Streptomyces sp. SID5468]CCB73181.1 Predicted oxidoreductase similar to aryl-alcohol dehydrogenase [Streptantibioticus cattleyicolor NRRL 8057 = DSM 46488]